MSMTIGVLVSHHSHVPWIRERWPECLLLARDYLTIQLCPEESFALFHSQKTSEIDWEDIVDRISGEWYRDEDGFDLVGSGGISAAQILTGSIKVGLATQIREFEAGKYWCSRLERLYVPRDESDSLRSALVQWSEMIEYYESPNENRSLMRSAESRQLRDYLSLGGGSYIQIVLRIAYLFQRCFFKETRRQCKIIFSDRTNLDQRTDERCLWTNHKNLRKSALIFVTKKELHKAKALLGKQDVSFVNGKWISQIIQREHSHSSQPMSEVIAGYLAKWFKDNLDIVALYIAQMSLLYKNYNIRSIQITSEFLEPYVAALQFAKIHGSKTSLRIDGHDPTGLSVPTLRSHDNTEYMLDQFFANSDLLYQSALKKGFENHQIIRANSVFLDTHYKSQKSRFDVMIMTWIPNNYNPGALVDSPSMTLEVTLTVVGRVIPGKIAIKIKDFSTEFEYVNALIHKLGFAERVDILEGDFAEHVQSSRLIIGGLGSAIAESMINGVRYLVYEPVGNGYSGKLISEIDFLMGIRIARNEIELLEMLTTGRDSHEEEIRSYLYSSTN